MEQPKIKLSFAEALRGESTPTSSSPGGNVNNTFLNDLSPCNKSNNAANEADADTEVASKTVTDTTDSTETTTNPNSANTSSSGTNSSFVTRCDAERELLKESAHNVAQAIHDEDNLCKLCDAKLKDARILSCLHIFCEKCLEILIKADKVHGSKSSPGNIECPLCKQLTQMDKRGIQSLTRDYLHANKMELSDFASLVCTSCKSKDRAVSHCVECDNFLCFGCDNAHKYMRCFENHHVVRFDEFKSIEGELGSYQLPHNIHKPIFCPMHLNKHLTHYCYNCQLPICIDCLSGGHCGNGHHCGTINEAENATIKDLMDLTAVANNKVSECQNASSILKTARALLLVQCNKAQEDIKETTIILKGIIDGLSENFLVHLKHIHAESDLNLWRQQRSFIRIMNRLQEANNFGARVCEEANSVEFLHLKPLISSQLIFLIGNTPKCMTNFAIGFKSEPILQEHCLRIAFGELCSDTLTTTPSTSPAHFAFQSPPQNRCAVNLDSYEVKALILQHLAQLQQQQQQLQQQPPVSTGLLNYHLNGTQHFMNASREMAPQFNVGGEGGGGGDYHSPPTTTNLQLGDARNQPPKGSDKSFNTLLPCSNPKAQPIRIIHNFGTLGTRKGHFNSPHGFCLGSNNEIVVADTNNHRIVVYDNNAILKFQFGLAGKEPGELWYPRKIALMPVSGSYVICDRGFERSRMQVFTNCGHFDHLIDIKYIDIVAGLSVTENEEIVAVDSVSPTIFIISQSGALLRWFDCSQYMCEPSDLAIREDKLYVCDFKGHGVAVFDMNGHFNFRLGHEKVTCFPNGIDISPNGIIYICDSHGNRFHVACYSHCGLLQMEYECPEIRISRCCGLKLSSEGNFITLAKNNHHVLVLNASSPSLPAALQQPPPLEDGNPSNYN